MTNPERTQYASVVELHGQYLTLRPLTPFQVTRVARPGDGARQLLFAFFTLDGLRNALFSPRSDSGWMVVPDDEERGVEGLVEVTESEDCGPWRIIDTGRKTSCVWPEGHKLASTQAGAKWSFELQATGGHSDSFLIQRGPFHPAGLPAPSQLVGPGQRVMGQGNTSGVRWIELGYDYDGDSWCQVHALGRVQGGDGRYMIVTGQGAKVHRDRVLEDSIGVAASIAAAPV